MQLLFDVDATEIQSQIAKIITQTGEAISITSYVLRILAHTVAADPRVRACRHKRREMIMFADVDLSVMVERDVHGSRMPLPYIVRASNQKDFLAID